MRSPLAPALYGRRDMHATPAAVQHQPTLEALGWTNGDELRVELLERVRETPTWKRTRVVYIVTQDGVSVEERSVRQSWWRRHGLHQLARQLGAVSLSRVAIVLEGDEVAILAVDAAAWIEAESAWLATRGAP